MADRYRYPLRIYVQPHRNPKNMGEAEANRQPERLKTDMVITGRNPDVCLKKARAYVEEMGHEVRAASLGPDGISVVVYRVEDSAKKDARTMKESRKLKGYR